MGALIVTNLVLILTALIVTAVLFMITTNGNANLIVRIKQHSIGIQILARSAPQVSTSTPQLTIVKLVDLNVLNVYSKLIQPLKLTALNATQDMF